MIRQKVIGVAVAAVLFAFGFSLILNPDLRLRMAALHSGEDVPFPREVAEKIAVHATFQGRINLSGPTLLEIFDAKPSNRDLVYGLFVDADRKSGKLEVSMPESSIAGVAFGLDLPGTQGFCLTGHDGAEKVEACLDADGKITVSAGASHLESRHHLNPGHSYALAFQVAGDTLEVFNDEGPPDRIPLGMTILPKRFDLTWDSGAVVHNLYVFNQPIPALGFQNIRGSIQSSQRILFPNEAGKIFTLAAILILSWIFGTPDKAVRRLVRVSTIVLVIYAGLFLLPLMAADSYLLRDNLYFHFSGFQQITSYLRQIGSFPDWYFTREGGVWTSVLSNNLLLTAPYRIAGYVLTVATGLSANLIYKFSFLAGVAWLFASGWILVREVTEPFRARLLLYAVLFIFSGQFVGLWHQEQVLGTMFWIPTLGWLGVRLNRKFDPVAFLLFGAVLGLAMNLHYPQILFITGLCALAALAREPSRSVFLNKKYAVWYLAFLGVAAVAALPLAFSYLKYSGLLASALRRQSDVETGSLAGYFEMHRLLKSSIHPVNFFSYFFPTLQPWRLFAGSRLSYLDDNILRVPQLLFPLVLAVAVFTRGFLKDNRFLLTLIALILVSTLGIYGPLLYLYWFVVPGIGIFRQWYHLLPIAGFLFGLLFMRAAAVWVKAPSGQMPVWKLFLLAACGFAIGGFWSGAAFLLAFLPFTKIKMAEWAKVLLLAAVIFGGNRTWLLHQSAQLSTLNEPAYVALEKMDQADYVKELLFNGRGLLYQLLVKIKDVKPPGPVPDAESFRPTLNGSGLQVEVSDKPYSFSQYNDQRWLIDGQLAEPGPIILRQPGVHTITRARDPWLWLVSVSYLCVILLGILYLLRQPVRGDH